MRALGPGSVASILKIALDCAYLVLLVAEALIALMAIGVLIALPFLSNLHGGHFNFDGHTQDLAVIARRGRKRRIGWCRRRKGHQGLDDQHRPGAGFLTGAGAALRRCRGSA